MNETSVQIDVLPCTGQPAELTPTESGVIHFAAFADGAVHLIGTLRGSFSADALPADGIPDAAGSTLVWFGGNGMLLEEGGAFGKTQSAFTLTIKGTNADGSTFRVHQNGNVVFDPDGNRCGRGCGGSASTSPTSPPTRLASSSPTSTSCSRAGRSQSRPTTLSR